MEYKLKDKLVVAVSSRALFDLEDENKIYEELGLKEYIKYQAKKEKEVLGKGTAYPLIEALLKLNEQIGNGDILVEVVILSENSPETGIRIFNSIESLGINITRAGFTGGDDTTKYLKAFEVDLFLSKNEDSVRRALENGIAAAQISEKPMDYTPELNQIRIAFDADAVIFSDEGEKMFVEHGLDVFQEHEKKHHNVPLEAGPFSNFLKLLSKLKERNYDSIKIAIVTARNSPAHKRVLFTLKKWQVKVDEIFFLGGVEKKNVLKAFNPHIFFDDRRDNVENASSVVPSSRVVSD